MPNDTSPATHPNTRSWFRRWWPKTLRTAVIVGVVCMAAGILFAIASQSAQGGPTLVGLDLRDLIAERQEAVQTKETANTKMQLQIDHLVGTVSGPATQTGDIPLLTQTVTGPGVSIKLTDSPAEVSVDTKINPNDLVVHQGDIDAVMNALWRGGAEAMTVQGIRVSPFLPVRCIGNVILVGSQTFAPPYVVEAIGDPSALMTAVDADPQIVIYQDYVRLFDLGWDMDAKEELRFPPLTEGNALRYAELLEETHDRD